MSAITASSGLLAMPRKIFGTLRARTLRANGIYLMAAATASLCMDLAAYLLGRDTQIGIPMVPFTFAIPFPGAHLVEAHALGFVIGVLLFRAAPQRRKRLSVATTRILLSTYNAVFWQFLIAAYVTASGYVMASLYRTPDWFHLIDGLIGKS